MPKPISTKKRRLTPVTDFDEMLAIDRGINGGVLATPLGFRTSSGEYWADSNSLKEWREHQAPPQH